MVTDSRNQAGAPAGTLLIKIAGATILLTVLALAVGGNRSWRNNRILAENREAWEVEKVAFERLSMVQAQFLSSDAACRELAGSWGEQTRYGGILRACYEQATETIEIGKLSLTSDYGYDASNPDPAYRDLPYRQHAVLLAGRCYSPSAEEEVLAYQEHMGSAAPLASVVHTVQLEGLERVASTHSEAGGEHLMFAIRLTFRPEAMRLDVSIP